MVARRFPLTAVLAALTLAAGLPAAVAQERAEAPPTVPVSAGDGWPPGGVRTWLSQPLPRAEPPVPFPVAVAAPLADPPGPFPAEVPLLDPPEVPAGAADPRSLSRYRKGLFQRAQVSAAWVARDGDGGYGQTTVDASLSGAVPLGSLKHLLILTPGFTTDFVDGPADIDVPARLYSAGVDVMYRGQFSERWGLMVGVRPAWTSDFDSTADALRYSGRALATWQCLPERLTLLFGVVVLNIDDVMVLPAAGALWTPTPDWRVDAVFPRPKVARRLGFQEGVWENWLYGAGQIGGQTWAVRREDGSDDLLTLRDYRVALGLEHVRDGGGGGFVEAGFVFGRRLEYRSLPGDLDFGNSVLIQAGVQY